MAVDHYENFPVASLLLPRHLVPAVQSIYAFARSADDIADEGHAPPDERLAALHDYEAALVHIELGKPPEEPLWQRLAATIAAHDLPFRPFHDLLSAFRQDVTVHRYATYDELLDYCRRSANPVGLLMLHLYGAATPENVRDSDAICTALQLINFWQDVAVDLEKERIYVPMEDLARFAMSPAHLHDRGAHGKWRTLMRFEVQRTRELMLSGAPLAWRLPGRIGLELRMVVHGGLRVLEAIEGVDYDVFRRRPTLVRGDWLKVFWRAMRPLPVE